jgi:hypothetical protein
MAAAIRPRGPAESFDLGFRMVRQWWRPVYSAWLLAVLPVYALVTAAGLMLRPRWTLLCLWWLRPLFDRVPLYVLSRCLFGAPPSWRQTLRSLPGLWRPQLVGALTWRRLDPWRSLHLPVRQLERLRGRQRRARLRLLGSGCRRQALGLTVGCALLEWGVVVGLFGLVHMLLPQPVPVFRALFQVSVRDAAWVKVVWCALFFLALSVVEPFYVGAGFALYLGQRTRFEGWDVEIAFRRLAARLAAAPAWCLALFLGLLGGGAAPSTAAVPAHTAAELRSAPGGRQVQDAVQEVLRAPEFGTLDQRINWVPRTPEAEAAADVDWEWPQLPLVNRRVKRGLMAVAGAGVLAFALLRSRRIRLLLPPGWRAGAGARAAAKGAGAPPTVRGLDVRPASLPADLPAAAWRLWERGEAAAALSLLYRGALAALMAHTAIRFGESWTEGDCLSAVRRRAAAASDAAAADAAGGDAASGEAAAGEAEFFARLTAAWQAAAYRRRAPDSPVMRDLCAGWGRIFGDVLVGAIDPAGAAPGPGSSGGAAAPAIAGAAGPRGAA